MMRFVLLGTVGAIVDGQMVQISRAQRRAVLGYLLLRANQAVSASELVDALWGGEEPTTARSQVYASVSAVRTALRAKGFDSIDSVADGYRLIVSTDQLDLAQFRDQLERSTKAAQQRPDDAARGLRSALKLWQGQPLSGITAAFVEPARVHLREQRLTAQERLYELELALGRHRDVLAELPELVSAHPLRESLAGQLMLALYRNGQQADALATYRRTRQILVEELGIDPGAELRRLHKRILDNDPELAAPPSTPWETMHGPQRIQPVGPVTATAREAAVDAGDGQVPRELPADVAGFAGRQDALKALDELLPHHDGHSAGFLVIAAIVGTAGVGKTALAVHWAHRVADHFPDGQLYLNLRGYAPGRPLQPIEALTTILTALGVPATQVPLEVAAAAARYRSQVAGRRMLVVLDNARSAAQVRPLLPASPGSLVLITSRDRLTGLVAQDGARRLPLHVLDPDESEDLLGWMLGRERAGAERMAVAELARTCAHLPLALRIAGAGLADRPHSTIAGYVAELAGSGPMSALAVDDDIAVRGALDLSYRTLPPPAQRLFRRLGLVPCPDFTAAAAAALTGLTDAEALDALDRLAAAHLVVSPATDRYTMHDLLRQYAADLAAVHDSLTDRVTAVDGFYDWLTAMSVAAAELLYPEAIRLPSSSVTSRTLPGPTGTAALDWLDAERHNVTAAILHAARNGPHPAAWWCADAMRGYYAQRGYVADLLSTSRAAVAAARVGGDLHAQASAYLGLASAHLSLDNHSRSIMYLRRAHAFAVEAGWDRAEASAACDIATALGLQGRTTESIEHLQRALQVNERIAWPLGRAQVMDTLATAYRDVGRLNEGRALATQAREIYRELSAERGAAVVSLSLGELNTLLGRLSEAEQLLESALTTFRAFGSLRGEAHCEVWLSRVHCGAGNLDRADRSAHTAFRLANEIDEPELQAMARHALALVHQTRSDHTGATRLHRAALNIAEQVGIRYTAAEALLGLAATLHGQGDEQAALDHAVQALALAHQCGYAVIEGRAHTILGQVHLHLRDTARALDHTHQALISHERTGHRIGEADSHLLLAAILHRLDDHTTADHHAGTARSLYREIGAPQPVPH